MNFELDILCLQNDVPVFEPECARFAALRDSWKLSVVGLHESRLEVVCRSSTKSVTGYPIAVLTE